MAVAKKKRWFKIIAPKAFRNNIIGETLSLEANSLIGKNASINGMSLLNDPRKQNLRLTFKITSVKTDQAQTELQSFEILTSHLKRFARKGNEKIEDSFIINTKNGEKIRIKPILTTRSKIPNSLQTSLRKALQAHLTEELKEKSYDEFILDVLSAKSQRAAKDQLKKLYPIANCEFRRIVKISA